MSTSIGYCFNSEKSLSELSDEINSWLGTSLRVSYTDGNEQSWCRFFGMSMDFYAHGLVNDGVIEFESFKYELSLVGPKDVALMKVSLMAMIAYLLYCRLGISGGILIFDVQLLLAQYETKSFEDGAEDLFDNVSGKRVTFPEHLVDIEQLID